MALFILVLVGITVILFDVNMDSIAAQENKTGRASNVLKQENLNDSNNSGDSVITGDIAGEPGIGRGDSADSDASLASTLNLDPNAWYLMLVNDENPLEQDLDIERSTISSGIEVDSRIYDALTNFLNAGRTDGINLFVCSGYRSVSYQTGLFERRVNRWINSGLGYDEAVEAAATSVAYPGTSEHHLGLAVDIVCSEYTNLNRGFGDTEAGIWLREHCAEYGFILRYPDEKTDITGYIYEPWHFRYVGVEAATYIMENNICFEEFWELLV